jgi:hypothetical protein
VIFLLALLENKPLTSDFFLFFAKEERKWGGAVCDDAWRCAQTTAGTSHPAKVRSAQALQGEG